MIKLLALLLLSSCASFALDVGGSLVYGDAVKISKKHGLDVDTTPKSVVSTPEPSATMPYGKEFN